MRLSKHIIGRQGIERFQSLSTRSLFEITFGLKIYRITILIYGFSRNRIYQLVNSPNDALLNYFLNFFWIFFWNNFHIRIMDITYTLSNDFLSNDFEKSSPNDFETSSPGREKSVREKNTDCGHRILCGPEPDESETLWFLRYWDFFGVQICFLKIATKNTPWSGIPLGLSHDEKWELVFWDEKTNNWTPKLKFFQNLDVRSQLEMTFDGPIPPECASDYYF